MSCKPSLCMCIYQRPHNIPYILEALENQTYKNFDLNIWCNCEKEELNKYLRPPSITCNVFGNNKNDGSKARFWLVPKTIGNPIIFFDDDQIPKGNFVKYMLNEYIERPNAVQSWKTRIFVHESYWKDSNKGEYGKEVDYVGTGGMVLDRDIFSDNSLMKIPPLFKKVEDLWLSFIARKKYNKPLIKIKRKLIKCREDQKDNQMKIFDLKKVKEDCFKELRNTYHWEILKDNILMWRNSDEICLCSYSKNGRNDNCKSF